MRTWPHVQAVVVGHKAVTDLSFIDTPTHGNSYISIYQYVGPDGQTYQGKTIWSGRPLSMHQSLAVCVNPQKPAESYLVEKTSRAMLSCLFVVMVAFCIGSFSFLRMLLGS
ncbi:DUF3592 domain-containing protein [Streptomyces celluloflavus]|uniref:DUF3592 domain-containing protein n=1 Tax=Streptomyces celluloflavus TaxID=58344 RepID=UPI0036DA22DB